MKLQVLTFNLLAPVYANPEDYPPPTHPYLGTEYRRSKWFKFLNTMKSTADIISLQEVTDDTDEIVNGVTYHRPGEYQLIKNYLDSEYYGQFFAHDQTYWSKYFSSDPASPYAYTKNGNALFFRKSRFQQPIWVDFVQSTGNHAVFGQTIDNITGKTIRAVAVHFDSDVGGNRAKEFDEVLSKLTVTPNTVNLIAGDFNATLDQGNLKQIIDTAGYKDVLLELSDQTGLPLSQRTAPDSNTYYNSPIYGAIDHIIYRDGTITPSTSLTTSGGVYTVPGQTLSGILSNKLFITYPEIKGYDDNEIPRSVVNFQLIGSDHFPVVATFD